MRKIFLAFFTFCFQFVFSQNNIDVLSYKFNIGLNDVNDTIYGVTRIGFIAKYPSRSIELDLASLNSDKKGMVVDNVVYEIYSAALLSFEHKNGKLKIDIDKQLRIGDTSFVTIIYKGIPADGLIISKTKYGHRSFFADNWPNRGHNWIPCHDDPADKATVEFIFTAPEHYQVVDNGVKI